MANVPSFKYIRWNGKQINGCESFEVEVSSETEVVKTINPNREGIGFQDGIPTYGISIEYREITPPEVDWRAHLRDRDENLLEYAIPGGATYQLGRVRISEVSETAGADGANMLRIRGIALRHREV